MQMHPMWVKLCTKDLTCRGYQLQLGKNVDTANKYNPTLCEPGGLHFCKVENVLKWAQILEYDCVCDVTIPPDAEAIHGNTKSKASKIILSNHRPLRECLGIYLAAVRRNGQMLEYVPVDLITPEMCTIAVRQNGLALQYVPAALKTFNVCITAYDQSRGALYYTPSHLKTILQTGPQLV